MEYIKKVDLLAAAVEVEYLGRPRMMVSVATIGKMPSIEAVPMEYHDKVCEEMARRHQAEILELTADRPQGECLVRCKECKYYKDEWCYWRDVEIRADDFCSYGQKGVANDYL